MNCGVGRRDRMSRLDEERENLIHLIFSICDYARLGYQISTFDNCNDCGNKKDCPYTPKPGAMVRWNCPLWKSEVKE